MMLRLAKDPKTGRRARWAPALTVILIATVALAIFAKGHGYKTQLIRVFKPGYAPPPHPAVRVTRPANQEINVLPDAFVAADVHLPNHARAIDGRSLTSKSVQLYRANDHRPVDAVVNTSGAGDAIVLKPVEPLELNTRYTFEVTPDAKDAGGTSFLPFSASFITAPAASFVSMPIGFDKVPLELTWGNMFTCVEVGPDHRLYASTLDGRILRYAINLDGTLGDAMTIKTVQSASSAPRLITGIKFDPASTADNLILWVNHGQLPPLNGANDGAGLIRGAADWSGKLSRLSGPSLSECVDYLIHLPRSLKDHLNNQIEFGPDGALYFCQASSTAMGAPDSAWGFRQERLLTAAILRVDVKAIDHPPLDVKTEDDGKYDPYAPGAPVTLYATGIRNSFDILFHSNGSMYCGINGSSSGGNTPATLDNFTKIHRPDEEVNGPYTGPAVPALKDVKVTENDLLDRVVKGGYYGHPNYKRGEFVLDGGNLTGGTDPSEIVDYPAGTRPDRNYRGYVFNFGKNLSPCGVIEYHGNAFGGALRGKILFVRFSGGDDIITLSAASDGSITESLTGIDGFTQFVNPVDLIEDQKNGNIYVAEFGGKRLTLLRPMNTALAFSKRVCRQNVAHPTVGVAKAR
ncbi:MAG TPA: Ig-like domain-containing protein [Tepidisphaeraceae bacterium]|jgi:glucose/arabinose dehydrogenase